MVGGKLYFAYGSNISLDQMAHRCPDAALLGPVFLPNYELRFRGNDGGRGVATIVPCRGAETWGVLWKLTPECEQALNRYEGFPTVYDKQIVVVHDAAGKRHRVMTYAMTHERTREPVLPSRAYYETIRRGYLQNGLPPHSLDQAMSRTRSEVWELERESQTDWPILAYMNPSVKKKGKSRER